MQQPTNRRAFLGLALTVSAIPFLKTTAMAGLGSNTHIALVGDSVFDNGAYVSGGSDVAQQVRERLPPDARVTLAARDGAGISDVKEQLRNLPASATHLVVSVGGNDALRHSSIISEKANSVSEVLGKLAGMREQFKQNYREMLTAVVQLGIPAATCTIYDARFTDSERRRLASVGLTVFNDCITRETVANGLAFIDLRLICNAEEDFVHEIEPSVIGGAKIAAAITEFAAEYHVNRQRTEVFA
jgi:hypothetical protein